MVDEENVNRKRVLSVKNQATDRRKQNSRVQIENEVLHKCESYNSPRSFKEAVLKRAQT